MSGIKKRMTIVIRLWQGRQELNPQPSVLETDALPIELHPFETGSGERIRTSDLQVMSLASYLCSTPHQYNIIIKAIPPILFKTVIYLTHTGGELWLAGCYPTSPVSLR